jgi:hypothetical protein
MASACAARSTRPSVTAQAVAHGAVLRHRRFVLEGDAQPRAVGGAAIPRAREVDDLIAFHRAAAGICGDRTDAGEVVDLDGEDVAVLAHRHAALDPMLARMDVGDEGFEPVGDELDRAAEQQGERDHRHLIGIDVDLDAEGPAHIPADDAHIGLLQREMPQHDLFHHVRRLRGAVQRELAVGGIELGEDRARLQADAGVAGKAEALLDHRIGAREGVVEGADVDGAGEAEIVAELGLDHRRAGRQRRLRVGHRRQRLPLDHDLGERILRQSAAVGDDRRHGLALPAGPLGCQRMLRRRFHSLQMREHADPRGVKPGEVGGGDDAHHARQPRGQRRVDAPDARMGMRTAQKSGMHQPRRAQVIDIGAAPLQQPLGIRARHRAADIAVGPIEEGQRLVAHPADLPRRARQVASTASTIAW